MTTESVSTLFNQTEDTTKTQELFIDRPLDNHKRFIPFDLLEIYGTESHCGDPEAKNYFKAKELFKKGYTACLKIPRNLDSVTLEKYENQIKEASELMVDAWLMDERAAPLTERILILGQQYERVLLKNIPKDEQDSFYVKYSLLFSAWILLVGNQFKHCLNTLMMAINTYPELPARVYFFRASCYFSLNEIKPGIDDLIKAIKKDPEFYIAYFILGSVYSSLENGLDNAIRYYSLYVKKAYRSSLDMVHSLYALSILMNHAQSIEDAKICYVRAMEAETEFRSIYGTHVGLSEIKRHAILTHEKPDFAKRLITLYTPQKQHDPYLIDYLKTNKKVLSHSPHPKRCSCCQSPFVKNSNKGSLMACGECKAIWYCSRECQLADYRLFHRDRCHTMKLERLKRISNLS